MKKTIAALVASLVLMPVTVSHVANAATETPAPAAEVQKAEDYFKNLKTARARFVQTLADGTQTRGTFSLSRPGRLRFQYDKPLEDFIVADGLMIYFYDGDLGEQTNAPISSTLADFLLRKNLKLSGDLTVEKIMRSGGLLQLTLVQTADKGAGTLTLGFTEEPFQLKKWRIRDAQGAITEIDLFDFETGISFPSGTFNYHDPKPKGLNR